MFTNEKDDDILFHIMKGTGLMMGECKVSNCAPVIKGIFATKPDTLPELVVLDLYIGRVYVKVAHGNHIEKLGL